MRFVQGFDVTAGATQLAFVNSPEGPDHDPVNAKRILTKYAPFCGCHVSELSAYDDSVLCIGSVLYMPVTSETPDWAIEKMAKCLKEAVKDRTLNF